MKKALLFLSVIAISALEFCSAQGLLDSCYTSAAIGTSFNGSANLVDATDADLMEWTGAFWNGSWSNANLTIPPPCNVPPVRAVFLGDQTVWTSGGEGFGLRFFPPLVAGNTYTFFFTYVSHGFGSNGTFSPDVHTNNSGNVGGNFVGNMTPAGNNWETHPVSFTAAPAQNGDDYIMIHSNDGSGMVLSVCVETFTALGPDSTICYGDSLILTAGNGFQSYLWNTGSTASNITVNASGTYSVTSFGFCDTISDTLVVTVDPCGVLPVALFNADNHICPGTCTDFTNLSQNATSYIWNFAGANPPVSTDINPTTICYNTPGTYGVELIAINSITSDTLHLNNFITVYPYPAPQGILQNGDTLFANAGATSYQWYHDGLIIPGATDYFYVAAEGGNYNVVATDNNGCEVEAVIFDIVAGNIQLAVGNMQLAIYPIPVNNYLNIHSETFKGKSIELSVYNMLGEIFIAPSEIMIDADKTCKADVSSLPAGIYQVRINANEFTLFEKFVKN
jgi:hypothetical protein